jgi:hypothetical protein
MVDVGTNTQSILDDPAYVGIRQKRDRSAAYDDLIKELFTSAQKLYGRTVLLQVIIFTCFSLKCLFFCCVVLLLLV